LVDEPEDADAVMVNTCGFIEAAKMDSINTLMAAADLKEQGRARAVVAVGCLAERYGRTLAQELTETDAVLGFDDYTDIASRLSGILHGERREAHFPRDRRTLLPLTPVERRGGQTAVPGHGEEYAAVAASAGEAYGARVLRRRLESGPMAPLKLASGCDRRCAFCAIPAFRGAYLSRRPADIVAEARWLADRGVKELFLVSENSTSYGKDLGDLRRLETLLDELSAVDGLEWIRVSYLQPAEMRPSLIEAMVANEKVVPYFDLSFQHASAPVLRRMRRFGDAAAFLDLIGAIRRLAPAAGIRSNVIVGLPGETEADVDVVADFLTDARLDAVGVFGYSDEEGTEAAGMSDKIDPDVVEERRARITDLAEQLIDQRAAARVGEPVRVLIEETGDELVGRAAHQGPEVDGACLITGSVELEVGDLVSGVVVDNEGVDLIVEMSP
jgi:ribosomal protein S12 methylthiotransferase